MDALAEPNAPTDSEKVEVAIIGAGFAGLGMAIKLRQRGESSFVVLEKAGEVGGTWRDNHYPGCACDIQSHVYSFSFEPNPEWARMFAPQPEILDYLKRCANKYELYKWIRFNSELIEARFDEAAGRWQLRTGDGRRYRARVLVAGMGPLHRPAIPDMPGIQDFAGERFHSAHWNHRYPLEGKRVAVIGTGASAIQFVPAIAGRVERLHVFQRTAPWIAPKPDRPITPAERERYRRQPWRQRLRRAAIYWTLEARILLLSSSMLTRRVQRMLLDDMQRIVQHPELAAKLSPSYRLGCKRILLSNDYYQALAQPHVEVITSGIRQVRSHSVIDGDGVEHPVDAIIYGTGFQAQQPLPKGLIYGPGGRDLGEVWAQSMEAYRGTTVAGFPNLFILIGPNTNLGHNSLIGMIEAQLHYVLASLRTLRHRRLAWIDVRPEAQAAYNRRLQRKLRGAVWSDGGCTSWYQNADGKVTALWPGFAFRFRAVTHRVRLRDYRSVPLGA